MERQGKGNVHCFVIRLVNELLLCVGGLQSSAEQRRVRMCRPDAAPIRIHYDCLFFPLIYLCIFFFSFVFACSIVWIRRFFWWLLRSFRVVEPSARHGTQRLRRRRPSSWRRGYNDADALLTGGGDVAEEETCQFGRIRRVKRCTGNPGKVAGIMMKWRAVDLLDEEVGSFELGAIITLY